MNDICRLRRALEDRGMQFLDNRAVRLGATDVYLVGIEDLMEGEPDLHGSLAGVPQDAPTVLLSHNPDIIEASAAARADLILAGHTHGGQIVLPLIGPTYHADGTVIARGGVGILAAGQDAGLCSSRAG